MLNTQKLHNRLSLYMFFIMVIPVFLIATYSIVFIYGSGKSARQDYLSTILIKIEDEVRTSKDKMSFALDEVSKDEILNIKLHVYNSYWNMVNENTLKADVILLSAEMKKYSSLFNSGVFSVYRRDYDTLKRIVTLGNSSYSPDSIHIETISKYDNDFYYTVNSYGLSFFISKTIYDGDEISGIILLEKKIDSDFFKSEALKYNVEIAVFLDGLQLSSTFPFKIPEEVLQKSENKLIQYYRINYNRLKYDLCYKKYNLGNSITGTMFLGIESSRLFKINNKPILSFLFFIAVSFIVPTLAFSLWSNKMIKSIELLVLATTEIGKGNFNYEITVNRDDEIGLLSDEFNRMTRVLKEKNESIENSNKELSLLNHYSDAVFQSLNINTIVINKDFKVILANKSAASELKIPLNETGFYLSTIPFFKTKETDIFPSIRKVFNDGIAVRISKLNNSGKVYSIDIFSIRNSTSSIDGAVLVIVDITDQTEMENELIQAGKLAAVGQFSSGIAHEIGNPLSVILNHVQLLRTGFLDLNEQSEYLERMESEVKRIDKLISGMLNYARKENFELVSLDLSLLVKDVLLLFSPKLKINKVIAVLSEDNKDAIIQGNRDALKQVIYNILNNAVEAIDHDDGIIKIKLDTDMKYANVHISDNGVGMEKELLGKVFDPFFSNKTGSNTGLGLGLTKKIILQHKGLIFIDSIKGQGTTIKVSIPLKVINE